MVRNLKKHKRRQHKPSGGSEGKRDPPPLTESATIQYKIHEIKVLNICNAM